MIVQEYFNPEFYPIDCFKIFNLRIIFFSCNIISKLFLVMLTSIESKLWTRIELLLKKVSVGLILGFLKATLILDKPRTLVYALGRCQVFEMNVFMIFALTPKFMNPNYVYRSLPKYPRTSKNVWKYRNNDVFIAQE